MTLLNPLLLAVGAATLAVPLWVHLRLGRVRKKKIVGSLFLMGASPQTSRTPRRLVNWWLFLLRCLIVLLIALGFARLSLPWLGQGTTVASAAIVLDISGSMQAKYGQRSSWDVAQQAALDYLGTLAPAARVAVFTSPSEGRRVEWTSPADARKMIRKLTPSADANQLHVDVLAAIAALNAMPDDQPKTLHIISDFQRTSIGAIDEIAIPQGIQLKLVKTSPDKPINRGLMVTVQPAGAANLRSYDFNDTTPGTISLVENNKTSSIPVGPLIGGETNRSGTILRRLQVHEADDLAADDTAYDVFQPQPTIPVWIWEPNATADKIQPEIDMAGYFVSRALQPLDSPGESVSVFAPQFVGPAALGDTNLPALLLIPAQAAYPLALADVVKKITTRGGSVIFFAGKNQGSNALDIFGPLAPVQCEAAEPVSIRPTLALANENNPLLGSLDLETRTRLQSSPLSFRENVVLNPAAQTLATFDDGKPFIVECAAGNGKTFFVNTSANRDFGDWAADAPRFVPVMQLLAARAVARLYPRPDDAPGIAGEPRTLRLDSRYARKLAVVEGTAYPIGADGTVTGVVVHSTGIKDVKVEGQLVGQIAVNFPPSESSLDNLSETVVLQRLENQRQHGTGATVRWENHSAGQLAWQLALLLASLLLLVEPLVADRKARP